MSVKSDKNAMDRSDFDYFSISDLSITADELFDQIRDFSHGYLEPGTLSILNNRISNSIDAIQILPSVTHTDKIEDVGHRVYLTIQDLLRAVDTQIFPSIVALNFNYQQWIQHCREERITAKENQNSLKELTDVTLDKPTTDIYDLRADVQIYEYREKLNAESYSASSGPFTLTPPARAERIAEQVTRETERLKMESRKLFLKAFDTWEKSKQNQNDAIPKLREIEQAIKRLTALEAVLEAFLTADRLIVSKLQAAITSRYPALCPILKESIRLPLTEEELTNPWDMKNLAGMAAIVYNTYHKPSFITFNNNLIKAIGFQISAEDSKTNPMKAVSGVQDLIFTWETHNLWAQMSPDHFWTAVLLRSLNTPSLFRDVLHKTQEFIRAHEIDPPSGRLPIFTFASTYIQNLQSDKTFNSGKLTTPSDKPYTGRSQSYQYSNQKLSGLEHAAAATTAPASSTSPPPKAVTFAPPAPPSGVPSHASSPRPTPAPPSATGPNPRTNTKGKTIYSTPFKTYQAPVHKSHKVFIDSHSPPNHPDNRPIRYLAVPQRTDVCAKCFAAEPTPCTPLCEADYCNHCTLFGHKPAHCMQVSASGVGKDAARR
jgi:hypothetical protein